MTTTNQPHPTAIRITVEPCHIGADATDADCRAYADAMRERLAERWSDSEIDVVVSARTHGMPFVRVEMSDESDGSEIVEEIKTIGERALTDPETWAKTGDEEPQIEVSGNWTVPPSAQGQIVERAYCASSDGAQMVRRTTDRSDGLKSYDYAPMAEDFDPINDEPQADWRPCSVPE